MKQGWEEKRLGDVCKVIAGQSPEGKYYNSSGNGLPFYQGKKEYGEKYIGEPRAWTTKITKEAEANDILMSVRAPVGPINFSTQKICIGRGLAAIRASKLIDKEFLFNFLLKHENEIVGNSGAVFNSINKSQIENIEIPLPPLPEQKRIVTILDKAFTAIAKAKDNAEQNLNNAKELFESYLQVVFENKGEGWEEKRFEGIIRINQIGLVRNSKEQGNDLKYRYVKMDAISINNDFIEDKCVYVDASDQEVNKFKLDADDFLFNTRNSYELVGKTCVYDPKSSEITLFNNNIMRVKFKKGISSRFVNYAFSSTLVKRDLEELKSGTTSVVGIYFKGLRNLRIPITDIYTQQTIVKNLDILSTKTKKLEAIYLQKVEDLEELKKSVLQKAFNGELN